MSEKKFLNCILIEGIILTVLGLCILILPKITNLSFGVMLSVAFISYGIYKFVHTFVNRNYSHNLILDTILSTLLPVTGILLLTVPRVSLLWLIALTGIYFLLESISTVSFANKIHNTFNLGMCKFFSAAVLFLVGFFIVVGIPAMAFWVVAMLSGIGFLIKGMSKVTLFSVNKNNV